MNIKLKESVVNMTEVQVKAGRSKEKPLNSMTLISARNVNMEESGRYAGKFDVPAGLASTFAGVAQSLGNNGIVIRGNTPKGLLWLLEEIEISNPNHFANLVTFGGGGLTALSSQMLATSDFFTGAFSAEYGDALTGVFDLNLRSANPDKREHTFRMEVFLLALLLKARFY